MSIIKKLVFLLLASLALPLVADDAKFVIKATPEEGRIIEEIINTIGNNNVLALGFKRNHLKQLGKQLHRLGSLQFLAYIFCHENLKRQMIAIRNNSFKWNGFVDGLIPGLNRDASSNLYQELPGFAKLLNIDSDSLIQKAKSREWYAFVNQLLQGSCVGALVEAEAKVEAAPEISQSNSSEK